jgi:hypothetical protein
MRALILVVGGICIVAAVMGWAVGPDLRRYMKMHSM